MQLRPSEYERNKADLYQPVDSAEERITEDAGEYEAGRASP